jgi:hypothetical protein
MNRKEALALVLNAAINNQRFNPYEFKNGEMNYIVDDILECQMFRKLTPWLLDNGFISELV